MDMPVMTLEQAQQLYSKPAYVEGSTKKSETAQEAFDKIQFAVNEAAKARLQAIMDTGLSVGLRSGLAWQFTNINAALNKRMRDFDTIYNFAPLLINERVVPPVITEARDLYNQEGQYDLRLSGALYAIEQQARFSSVPPSWREYLAFPVPSVQRTPIASSLTPRDGAERDMWKLSVADGWRQGVGQANVILEAAFDRMNRDFTGMLRFHTFVMQGKITLPAIASESIAVTSGQNTMAVDETLLRITTLPAFNNRIEQWKSGIKGSKASAPKLLVPIDGSSNALLD